MKKTYLILLLLLIFNQLSAQNKIFRYEYWFDSQYNNKQIVTLNEPQVNYFMNETINIQHINAGMHKLHIRFEDTNGNMSAVTSHFFIKMPITNNNQPTITAFEYWTDGNYNQKIYTEISPEEQSVLIDNQLDMNQLNDGIHVFHIRFKDNSNRWSETTSRFFLKKPTYIADNKIIAYKYWFNDLTDNILVVEFSQPENPYNLVGNIQTPLLPLGEHFFNIQFKDLNGVWSAVSSTSFMVTSCNPAQPQIPAGESISCQGSENVIYSIVEIPRAESYEWQIEPENAGVVNGNSSTIEISWATDFTGVANIKVRGVNDCATGEWSPTLSVNILQTVISPSIPNGETELCKGNLPVQYTVNQVDGAETYNWDLSPYHAGSVYYSNSDDGSTVEVMWNENFSGIAELKVRAINSCSLSEYSNPLIINVNELPQMAGTPIGETNLCQNAGTSSYSINEIANAISYIWNLSPQNSGSITNNGTSAVINWNPEFFGNAQLSVKAVNNCGEGEASQVLEIQVEQTPAAPIITVVGNTAFCEGNSVLLSGPASDVAVFDYFWSNGAETQSIEVSESGNFSLQISVSGGCLSQPSEIVTTNVLENPAQPSITINGEADLCFGESTELLVNEVYTEYLWSNGEQTQTIEVSTAGNYSATVANQLGCWSVPSETVNITVETPPQQPEIEIIGITEFCAGDSVILEGPDSFVAQFVYLWSNGETSQAITVYNSGDYSLQISISGNCYSQASLPVSVTVYENPAQPQINVTGETEFCEGGSVNLSVPNNYETYTWSNGEQTQTIEVFESGIYNVLVTNSFGCESTVSENVEITVYETPAQPQISQNGDALISTSASAFQWYNSTGLVENAVNQTFEPAVSGSYYVEIFNENNCSAVSDAYYFIHSATNYSLASNCIIYPSPASNFVFINFQTENIKSVEIFDMQGKLIRNFDFNKISTSQQLDIQQITKGLYVLKIKTEKSVISTKMNIN